MVLLTTASASTTPSSAPCTNRRNLLACVVAPLLTCSLPRLPALAFVSVARGFDSSADANSCRMPHCFRASPSQENRLPPDEVELKYKTPRSPGPKPTDLGVRDGSKLKACIDGKPHCFSSSPETIEDNDLFNADDGTTEEWLVTPFRYDKALAEAFRDVKAAVAAYPPGREP